MKTTILFVAMSLVASISFGAPKAAPAPAKFERQYGMAGCGLGSQVMGKGGSQVFAGTTNGTSWSQLFGITSGTSNCLDGASEEVAQKMDRFIQVNKVALAGDMAKGNGEALTALATIVGCNDSARFGEVMQKSFGQIYSSENVKVMEVTDSVITVIRGDADLKKTCTHVI